MTFRARIAVAGLMAWLGMAGSAVAQGSASALPEPRVPIDNSGPTVGALLRCLDGKATLVSGHRGGVGPGKPENAIETLARTLAHAPMLLEVDVRTTRDGVLVLMHDETIDRTTTGTGAVADLTWAELGRARLQDNDGRETGFRVPRLADALAWAKGRAILLLDIKQGVSEAAVVAAIRAAGAHPRAAAIVYSDAQARRFLELDPLVTVSYPVQDEAGAARLAALAARGFHLFAWTGIERPRPELWAGLSRRSAPISHGTLFYADRAIAMTGETDYFADLSRRGVDVIATDLHFEAFDALDARRDTASALRACGAAR